MSFYVSVYAYMFAWMCFWLYVCVLGGYAYVCVCLCHVHALILVCLCVCIFFHSLDKLLLSYLLYSWHVAAHLSCRDA